MNQLINIHNFSLGFKWVYLRKIINLYNCEIYLNYNRKFLQVASSLLDFTFIICEILH